MSKFLDILAKVIMYSFYIVIVLMVVLGAIIFIIGATQMTLKEWLSGLAALSIFIALCGIFAWSENRVKGR